MSPCEISCLFLVIWLFEMEAKLISISSWVTSGSSYSNLVNSQFINGLRSLWMFCVSNKESNSILFLDSELLLNVNSGVNAFMLFSILNPVHSVAISCLMNLKSLNIWTKNGQYFTEKDQTNNCRLKDQIYKSYRSTNDNHIQN